jgi:hypothetical protein
MHVEGRFRRMRARRLVLPVDPGRYVGQAGRGRRRCREAGRGTRVCTSVYFSTLGHGCPRTAIDRSERIPTADGAPAW